MKKIAIVGGGAAGYFVAANLGKKLGEQTVLFEQANLPLQKVRISGGGRCNVTHACFDPLDLVEYYPRGKKELLSVFYTFQPGDTMAWFSERGVELKIEDDNRIFPVSDSSLSIINALTDAVEKNKVQLNFSDGVQEINKIESGYELVTKSGKHFFESVIVTTGSTPKFWKSLKNLGLKIVNPVPSLFTFNCKDSRIEGLMGISFDDVTVKINQQKLNTEGPLLITHWGFSGPAILRLSAWGALKLNECNYKFETEINFINQSKEETIDFLTKKKIDDAKKNIHKNNPFSFPKRFWLSILNYCNITEKMVYADLSKKQINFISSELTEGKFQINGKSTFKDEFVTAGGVDLKEIDFNRMVAKNSPNLYLAGEVLNIDAITGGFNFQACWSEAYIIAEELKK
ncbi:NAD(P)/FAD-dependent oxidoreductase [Chishuiella sp.]|uniref:NAD(P)/FAD-dependent oxidoreductase n=1 Tax=Chishuiella sp. TaxID=1969467 RepID=UPI0028AE8146|nr:NAD(P)/FAD-dependent oxidoreductase [Chishuiella sp.]